MIRKKNKPYDATIHEESQARTRASTQRPETELQEEAQPADPTGRKTFVDTLCGSTGLHFCHRCLAYCGSLILPFLTEEDLVL
jgi:hypothetical protein